jgi:AraC family ethanolamine operon transcriptional activator
MDGAFGMTCIRSAACNRAYPMRHTPMRASDALVAGPAISAELVAGDVDDYLRGLPGWEIECTQISKDRFSGRTRYLKSGGLELFEKTTRGEMLQAGCTPCGTLTLGIPHIQSDFANHNGQRLAAGDMIVLTPSSEFELRTPVLFNFLAVSVSLARIARHLDSNRALQWRDFAPGHSFVLSGTPTSILAAEIRRLLSGPGHIEADAHSHSPTTPATEILVQAIAGALSCDISCMNAYRSTETRRRMVSRARRYIASMINAPLRVSEICRNIGASPRTLQYSFIEVLGITPLAYIKVVRLNAARRAIKGARQGRPDIGDIAFQYGFTHLSKFARDYKQAFGELPSQTRDRINPATRLDTHHSLSLVAGGLPEMS